MSLTHTHTHTHTHRERETETERDRDTERHTERAAKDEPGFILGGGSCGKQGMRL